MRQSVDIPRCAGVSWWCPGEEAGLGRKGGGGP